MVRILSSMLSAGGRSEMWTFLGKQDATVKISTGENKVWRIIFLNTMSDSSMFLTVVFFQSYTQNRIEVTGHFGTVLPK